MTYAGAVAPTTAISTTATAPVTYTAAPAISTVGGGFGAAGSAGGFGGGVVVGSGGGYGGGVSGATYGAAGGAVGSSVGYGGGVSGATYGAAGGAVGSGVGYGGGAVGATYGAAGGAAVMGGTTQMTVPTTISAGSAAGTFTEFASTTTTTRETGAPVYISGASSEVMGSAVVNTVHQEQVVAGSVSQNVVEIPTD